jgi:hypothetical protein
MCIKRWKSRFGQNRMCVCHDGSQGQIQRAIVLKKQEEEEEKKKN